MLLFGVFFFNCFDLFHSNKINNRVTPGPKVLDIK